MKRMLRIAFLSITMCALTFGITTMGEEMVKKGKKVTFDYTLKVDGQVVDTSEGKESFQYVHGKDQMLPALENELSGMEEGEKKHITLSPEDAYGQVNEQAFREMPKEQLPQGQEPQEGMALKATTPDGKTIPVTIAEVKEESVVINYNHPLAGKTLDFDVKIKNVQ